MRKSFLLVAALVSQHAFADVAESAKAWFETEYAPNYISPVTDHPERLRQYYLDESWFLNGEAGNFKNSNSEEIWIGWWNNKRSAGWSGSTLEEVEAQQLNPTTALLRVRWSAVENEQSVDSCNVYIATKDDGIWRFATVIDVQCADIF